MCIRDRIDQLASGFEIPIVEPTLADGRAPGTKDYLLELQQKLDALRADREILQKQLELCEKGTGEFSHFFGLTLPVDEAEKCEYIKLRFLSLIHIFAQARICAFAKGIRRRPVYPVCSLQRGRGQLLGRLFCPARESGPD